MTTIAKAKEKRFDPAKVQSMAEPFTARIEKKKGNAVMPVFQKEGLSRDDVMQIENWILTQWTGGGFYEGRLTDSQGSNMDWTFAYDPSQYPERVPPELGQAHANPVVAAAAAAGQTAVMLQPQGSPPPQQTQQQQQPTMSSAMPMLTPGTPTVSQASAVSMLPQQQFASMLPQQQQPQYAVPFSGGYMQVPQQNHQMPQVMMMPQQGYSPSMSGVPGIMNGDDRIRTLETQLRDQQLEKKDLEYRAALTAIQQASAQQIAALQAEIRRMGDSGSASGNAQVEALKKQLEDQRTAMLEQQIRALADAVTKAQAAPPPGPAVPPEVTAMIEALKQQNAETQRRLEDEKRQREAERMEERHRQEIQAVQTQMQQLAATIQQQSSQVPNPMLEAVRNMADRMMGIMVNPVQMIELMDRKGNAADGVIKTMMDMMQGIAGMYQQAVQITSSGGPSTTGVIVQEAINKIGDGIQAAAAAVRDRGVMAEKVKVEQARAQAAMANALVQRAALEPQPHAQGALNGAPVEQPQPQPPQPQPQAAAPVPPTAAAAPVPTKKNGGQPSRERTLLGVAYDEVMTLRKAVADGKLDAKGAAAAIYQGAGYMRSNGIEIPAFKLLENEQYADFVEALLPGLKDEFLGAVVTAFVALIENDGVEMPDDDGGDADSVDEEETAATASADETESETPAAT